MIRLICDPENIELFEDNIHVQLYPNPTLDIIKIDAEKVLRIDLVNSSGIIIDRMEFINENKEIDLSGYISGFYFIKIYTVNGMIVKRIVKQ